MQRALAMCRARLQPQNNSSASAAPANNAAKAPKPFKLRGKRPIGVDDFVENIPQGPEFSEESSLTEDAEEEEDGVVYSSYDRAPAPPAPGRARVAGGVGGKIGLEKVVGIPGDAGAFGMSRWGILACTLPHIKQAISRLEWSPDPGAFPSGRPMTGRERIQADEEMAFGGFDQVPAAPPFS